MALPKNTPSTYIEYEIPFQVNSLNDSELTSADGSRFRVNLDVPLVVPINAKHAFISVQNATIWNNVHNVTSANNKLDVTYDDGIIVVNNTLIFPDGLYDIAHLQSALERLLLENNFPGDLFRFEPDTSSGVVVISFDYTGVQIDFTVANSINNILGFDNRLVPLAPTVTVNDYERGDSEAKFNNINSFQIHTDLVHRGIRINSGYSRTIASVNITEPPGSQITYVAPTEHPHIPCTELVGTLRTNIEFWLTDENNNSVNTNGEAWSVGFSVRFVSPIDNPPQ
jgi:hypothetical protein